MALCGQRIETMSEFEVRSLDQQVNDLPDAIVGRSDGALIGSFSTPGYDGNGCKRCGCLPQSRKSQACADGVPQSRAPSRLEPLRDRRFRRRRIGADRRDVRDGRWQVGETLCERPSQREHDGRSGHAARTRNLERLRQQSHPARERAFAKECLCQAGQCFRLLRCESKRTPE